MWLWSRAEPSEVIDWAEAHGVTEIFAYAATDIVTNGDLPRLEELKDLADEAEITLSALGGDPAWVFDHEAALDWQQAVLGTGLFAGSHVDVEPYALSAWQTNQSNTVTEFLDMMAELDTESAYPLEADVAFWYSEISATGGNLADELLERVDAVTIMSYRDTATGPNSMTAVGADMLNRATNAGIPVRLGAETQNLWGDCNHCTFYEEGPEAMDLVLADVDDISDNYAQFAGIAVHHYTSWVNLPSGESFMGGSNFMDSVVEAPGEDEHRPSTATLRPNRLG